MSVLITACRKGVDDIGRVKGILSGVREEEKFTYVNIKDKYGNTALQHAASGGHVEIVRHLIESGADVNSKNNTGETVLIGASHPGMGMPDKRFIEIIPLLIEAGAKVNIQDTYGLTALHRASDHEQIEIVRLLIESGANPYITSIWDKKPIDMAPSRSRPIIREIYEEYETLESHQRLSLAKTLGMNPEDPRYTIPPEILELIATKRPRPSSEVHKRYKAEEAASEDEVKPTCTHNCAIQGGGSKRRKSNKKKSNKKKSKKARYKKRSRR